MAERLNNGEIVVLRSLIKRGANARAVTLQPWQRKIVVPLWRRGLIEIWYRQSPDSFQGPYYGLSIHGAYVASSLIPAPRGSSGAEEKQ